MQRVLIFAYHFPPYNAVSSQRPWSWYIDFHKHGLWPVIVTRKWDDKIQSELDYAKADEGRNTIIEETKAGTIIRVPTQPNLRDKVITRFGMNRFSLFRKLLSTFYLFAGYFPAFDRSYPLFKEAKRYVRQNPIDCIMATGGPFVQFRYASKLSKVFGIPWIADYRDNWSGVNNDSIEMLNSLYNTYLKSLEARSIHNASAVTVASPTYLPTIKKVGREELPMSIVYNGYQELQLEDYYQLPADQSEFRIVYAGKLYNDQHIEIFLQGLGEYLSVAKVSDVKLYFVGSSFHSYIEKRIEQFKHAFPAVIEFCERMSYQDLMVFLRQSHVLLLLSDGKPFWLRAKLFDYLGVGRPVLMVPSDNGIMKEILQDSKQGAICSAPHEVLDYLNVQYNLFQEGKTPSYTPSDKYNRAVQTKRLAQVMKDVINL